MSLRRGFKAEAERIAAEIREELNLSLDDRLDPLSLARHLCIPVLEIGDLAALSRNAGLGDYFLIEDADCLSALTLFDGTKRTIVHNESHAPTRQVSNLAHEISHCLLEHVPEPVARPDGRRCWNEEVEAEATWLGGHSWYLGQVPLNSLAPALTRISSPGTLASALLYVAGG
jgi:Zn-dependent peptidase ImmA (M78 family)